jgi:hypothetical protein
MDSKKDILLKKTNKIINEVKLYLSSNKGKKLDYYFLVKKYNLIKLNYYILKK